MKSMLTMEKKGRRARLLHHPLLRRYFPLVHEDLARIYGRDLQKWLIVAPVIGVVTGLVITGIVVVLLNRLWPAVLSYYLQHHWVIVPAMVAAFAATGLIMQYLTPDPNEHSTEEIIRSYHERQGQIGVRPFIPKLLAAIVCVGFGGSAALEGPSIYSGGAIGSWLWSKLRWLRLSQRDRRIMLICGAAAGMSAVFRAPLTGIVFALEMPYRDDLAHEALVPSLIASVVAFVTLSSFLGAAPLFNFAGGRSFTRIDLFWSALLGLAVGAIATVFVVTFRRARVFFVRWALPHWMKLTLGGLGTALCGLLFLAMYPGNLVPLGPNYEAVEMILNGHHGSAQLIVFSVLKLAATIFTLGAGGVSAMFVPLFLTGGAIGSAFAQSLVHSSSLGLYAAVGMASFISAGYKTPLAAAVFVAEATGAHAFIVPALIGAAVAYAVSGDASASGDQRLHETVRLDEIADLPVSRVMEPAICVDASLSVQEFVSRILPAAQNEAFAIVEEGRLPAAVTLQAVVQAPAESWATTALRSLADQRTRRITPDWRVSEALGLLLGEGHHPVLLVVAERGEILGMVTKSGILRALELRGGKDAVPQADSRPADAGQERAVRAAQGR